MKNHKKQIMISIIILLIIILTFSLFNIGKWFLDNKNNEEVMDLIDDSVIIKEIEDEDTTTSTNSNISNIYYDYTKVNLIDVDFKDLLSMNKDTKGWIQVTGTKINYPYVQTKDNDYYLNRSFDKKYNDAGWVFMDYRNNSKDFDKNTIIYAHARKNNTMFGSLDTLLKKDWFKTKENHTIRISTTTSNSVWQIFSVYHIPTTNDYIQVEFKSNDEFLQLINTFIKRSVHNFNTKIDTNDKILTLSTCYNDDEKLVVHAKLVKSEKKTV